MNLSSWGKVKEIINPVSYIVKNLSDEIPKLDQCIPRGNGRSYGDSSLYKSIISYKPLDPIINFLPNNIIEVSSDILFSNLLEIIIPRGLLLPVMPGTSFVTIGGAIASDIHGKNHHISGSISSFVEEIKLLTGNGEIYDITPKKHSELFYATLGGMGLTGLIISAKIKLLSISSPLIHQEVRRIYSLDESINALESRQSNYSTGWLDLTMKKNIKGIIFYGDHNLDSSLSDKAPSRFLSIPKHMPNNLLNKLTIYIFNKLYFLRNRNNFSLIHLRDFFFPLDSLRNWNNFYGSKGLLQFQPIFPTQNSRKAIAEIHKYIHTNKMTPMLAVIKNYKKGNDDYLSFAIEGISIAIDFVNSRHNRFHVKNMNKLVQKYDGKIYLSKDFLLDEESFKTFYPNWKKFNQIRKEYGSDIFTSNQSIRIGLDQ